MKLGEHAGVIQDVNKEKKDAVEKYFRAVFFDRKGKKREGILERDAVNFWMDLNEASYIKNASAEEKREFFELLKPKFHYRESYEINNRRGIETVRRDYGEEKAKFYEVYYPKELERRMELSDPGQVEKYNKLVDRFNEDLERIKKEQDTDILVEYLNKAVAIIEGRK